MGTSPSSLKAASLAVALMLGGCASSSAMRAAERGDLPALRKEIASVQRAGKLSNHDAAQLARKVATREIEHAPKGTEVERVRDVRSCAGELDSLLSSRMDTHDEAGAEAAMARLDAGNLSAGSARSYSGDKNEGWRAVGARGLVREKDTQARLAAMTDGSPLVRRAAMRASAEAGADEESATPTEIEQLATSARVDPEPIVRTEAVRALAAIGGADVVAKLRDLVTSGDDGLRGDIGVAWVAPRIYKFGGYEPLRLLLAADHGPGTIEAAAAALRSEHVSTELRASASAVLARAIASGGRQDRLHAILLAKVSDPVVLAALRDAGKVDARGQSADREIEIAANSRLVESPPDRALAIRSLETRAGQDLGKLSMRARWALAEAHDLRVQAWVENDLNAADPYARLSAASALSSLGRAARGAPLLADENPLVRTRAACTLLLASRVKQ